jgi:ubiquinone/menaquinone biosynthesis C-methylase UbiE
MPWERDVGAFDSRAETYDQGWRSKMHKEIVRRSVDLALSVHPEPAKVLDVGCGTGVLLRDLASRLSDKPELIGIDAARRMIAAAMAAGAGTGTVFEEASVENLPFDDGRFDLVVSTTSFDHWDDQGRGIAECARVLCVGGHFVCVDQFSSLLWPTLLASRRGKARTKPRAERLLRNAGLKRVQWHDIYALIIKGIVASR